MLKKSGGTIIKGIMTKRKEPKYIQKALIFWRRVTGSTKPSPADDPEHRDYWRDVIEHYYELYKKR